MLKRLTCAIFGHTVPAITHPWWGDVFHATCLRCRNKCVGHFDPEFGTVYWEVDHSVPTPHPLDRLVDWLIDRSKP